ncbi:MAG: hypothetical protein AAF805_00285 [Planctomycetota bacterium]
MSRSRVRRSSAPASAAQPETPATGEPESQPSADANAEATATAAAPETGDDAQEPTADDTATADVDAAGDDTATAEDATTTDDSGLGGLGGGDVTPPGDKPNPDPPAAAGQGRTGEAGAAGRAAASPAGSQPAAGNTPDRPWKTYDDVDPDTGRVVKMRKRLVGPDDGPREWVRERVSA